MINQLKTILLLSGLAGLMLAAGVALGGKQGLIIALFFAVGINVLTYFFSDKLVLMMYGAKEAKKREHAFLHKIVEEVAHAAHIPKPRVYIIPTQTPNAFATGRNPSNAVVACTEGILRLLTHDELRGVIGHEIGHVKNRDILVATIAATMAAVISYLANFAQYAAIFGSRDDRDSGPGALFAMLALAIITPIIAMIIQFAISRSREYLADETGAKLVHDPRALARALAKLHEGIKHNPLQGAPSAHATASLFILNPFSARGLVNLLSTHPPVQERIKRLEAMNN